MTYVSFWVLTREADARVTVLASEEYEHTVNTTSINTFNRNVAAQTDAELISFLGAAALGVLFQYTVIEPLLIMMRFTLFPFVLRKWGNLAHMKHPVQPKNASAAGDEDEKNQDSGAALAAGGVALVGAGVAGEVVKGSVWDRSSEATFNLLALVFDIFSCVLLLDIAMKRVCALKLTSE